MERHFTGLNTLSSDVAGADADGACANSGRRRATVRRRSGVLVMGWWDSE